MKKYETILILILMVLLFASFATGQSIIDIESGGTATDVIPTDGQLFIGNTSGYYNVSTITAGANIIVTNASGTITIASTGAGAADADWTWNGTLLHASTTATSVGIGTTTPSGIFEVATSTGDSVFRIDKAGDIVVGTWKGTAIADAYIPDTITASNYLLLTGGTISGTLTVSETSTLATSTIVDLTVSGATTLNTSWTGVLRTDSGVVSTTTAGSGDVTSVGDCADGDCFDGTSDGGTYLNFYDAQGIGKLTIADLTAVHQWTLPDATGTVIVSGHTFTADVTATLDADGSTVLTINNDAVQANDISSLESGRSLTWDSTNDLIDADAELYTDMITFVIRNATSTQNPVACHKFATAVTITRISGSNDNSTSSVQFDERMEAAPYSAGTDVMTAALELSTATASTTSFDNSGIAADAPFCLDLDTVNGNSTTSIFLYVDFTKND